MKRVLPFLFSWVLVHSLSFAQINQIQSENDVTEQKNALFNDAFLQKVEITIPADTLIWLFKSENLKSDYKFKADMVFTNGTQIDTVREIGFRLRGNTSRQAQKKSFTVDINEFVKGRRFYGLKALDLNGEHNDPSMMRTELSWDFLRSIDLPATRSTHVEVYINGDFYGVYQNVENIDDVFLEERFGNSAGNFYKCLYPANLAWRGIDPNSYKVEEQGRRMYELKTNEDADDYTDLRDFIQFLEMTSDADFANKVEDKLDVDGVLRWLAADILLGNWDNYWHNKNNYYLYNNPKTKRFHFVPYDYDNNFGIAWDDLNWATRNPYSWTPTQESRKLVTRVLAIKEYKDRLSYYIDLFSKSNFSLSTLENLWITKKNLIQTAAEADLYRTKDYNYSINDFNRSFTESTGNHDKNGIKPYVTQRLSSLKYQLILNAVPVWISDYSVKEILPDIKKNAIASTPDKLFELRFDFNDDKPLAGDSLFTRFDFDDESFKIDTLVIPQSVSQNQYSGLITKALPAGNFVRVTVTIKDSDGLKSRFPKNPDNPIYFYTSATAPLIINEILASNKTGITDEAGEFEDWIELYNNSDQAINLNQFTITDTKSEPALFSLPDSLIPARSFVLVWADNDGDQGPLHANFKLSKSGEYVGLFNKETGKIVDEIIFDALGDDQSFQRISDGSTTWKIGNPSPGKSNNLPTALVDEVSFHKPNQTKISSVYPNPFNPTTTIEYTVSKSSLIALELFDVMGRKVQTLVSNKSHSVGTFSIQLNANTLSSGLYFIRLQSIDGINVKKIMLIK